MEFTRTTIIEQDVETVWKVLAHEFDRVSEWNSEVSASAAAEHAAVPSGANVGGRVCHVGVGEISERFTSYSEEAKTYSFEVTGLPSMVTGMTNHTRVAPVGPGRSEVALTLDITFGGLGRLVGPFVGMQMRRIVDRSLDDMKVYIETGHVSQRKQKQLAKAAR